MGNRFNCKIGICDSTVSQFVQRPHSDKVNVFVQISPVNKPVGNADNKKKRSNQREKSSEFR